MKKRLFRVHLSFTFYFLLVLIIIFSGCASQKKLLESETVAVDNMKNSFGSSDKKGSNDVEESEAKFREVISTPFGDVPLDKLAIKPQKDKGSQKLPEIQASEESVMTPGMPDTETIEITDESLGETVSFDEKIPKTVSEKVNEAFLETGYKPNILSSVDALANENGLLISLKSDFPIREFETFTIPSLDDMPARVVFDLFDVQTPFEKEQFISVKSKWAERIRHYKYPEKVRMVIDTRDQYLDSYSVIPVEKGLKIMIGPNSKAEALSEKEKWPERTLPGRVEDSEAHFAAKNLKSEFGPSGEKTPENQGKPSQTGEIVLNFDNADLYEVIRTLSEILQINYIIDSNVRGNVTIHTAGKLKGEDLFPVFFQILEANGLTAVKEGSLYKIVNLKDASQLPVRTRINRDHKDVHPDERIIIQIIPLEFISVQEMTKVLTPFVTAGGTIVSHEDSNTLLIVDKAFNIEKVLRLIDVFDIDLFEKVNHRFYRLQYVDAEESVKTVEEILASYVSSGKDEFKLVPIVRINALLLVSKNPRIFQKLDVLIEEVDVPVMDDEPRIYVYPVKNGGAAELSDLLNSVFSKTDSDKKDKSKLKPEPEKERPGTVKKLFPSKTSKKVETVKGERVLGEASGTLKGEVKITPDEIRNSLIIEAAPRDYRVIENILQRIDILPRQVLIEVTLAEITLNTETDLGINWTFDRLGAEESFVAGLQDGASLGSGGIAFSYAILDKNKKWTAMLSAMAKKDKANILSSPTILASDNKEAEINVSTEVPVASSTYTYDYSDDAVLQTSIEYRNTGVILSVTPHINEFGLVSMDVSQEVSEVSENVEINDQESRPSFFKRSINTSLTVKNGQTIVLGGLMRENKSQGRAGIPCLGEVPVLSYIFGSKSKTLEKNELIIFITPKVIATLDDVDAVSLEFKERVGFEHEKFWRTSPEP